MILEIPFDLEERIRDAYQIALNKQMEMQAHAKNEYGNEELGLCIYAIYYTMHSHNHKPNEFSRACFANEEYAIRSLIFYPSKVSPIGEYIITFSLDWEIVNDSLSFYFL